MIRNTSILCGRFNVSPAVQTAILATVLKTGNQDLNKLIFSNMTVIRIRNRVIEERAAKIRQQIIEKTRNKRIICHIDTKKIERMDENFVTANQERLACVITSPDFELKSNGNCEDILLGICECDSGKGVDMANELYNIIQSFDLEGQIIGICADTTASNTGTYYITH